MGRFHTRDITELGTAPPASIVVKQGTTKNSPGMDRNMARTQAGDAKARYLECYVVISRLQEKWRLSVDLWYKPRLSLSSIQRRHAQG